MPEVITTFYSTILIQWYLFALENLFEISYFIRLKKAEIGLK